MRKISIQSDKYFNNKGKFDMIYGEMAQPVDMNGGLVLPKTDKWGMCDGCVENIEDNIQERFGLEDPNDD